MKLKKTMGKLHLWLSLIAGTFICLIALSGSALVFKDEINRMLNADLYKATPGPAVSYQAALQSVLTAYPKADISRIYSPNEMSSEGIYTFSIKADKKSLMVYVDPGTGNILGTQSSADTLTGWLSDFHENLLLKDYNGRTIVGIIAIFFFLILLTGMFIWFPGLKNWMRGFVIRRTTNQYVRHFDLHRVFGISWVPFLLVVSLTGFLFPFGKDILGAFNLKTSTSPSDKVLVAKPLPAGYIPLDDMIASIKKEMPDATITQIRMPKKAGEGKKEGVIEFRLSHQYDPSASSIGNARAWVEPYSGKVLAITDSVKDTSFASIYQTWLFPLHTGRIGGLVTQILYAIGGLVPTLLMVTGLVMMRLKQAKKKKSAASPAARKTAQPESLPQAQ
ncbi:UNVERIFIED_CONTAM: putative iron-regulated membrane protein [Brevibacillus sp. OAP136]